MTKHYKQSRTYHLPFSEGLQNDDRKIEDEFCFNGKTVRKGHIQPNEIHWIKQEIVPNKLKPKFDHNGECLECYRWASDCICLK